MAAARSALAAEDAGDGDEGRPATAARLLEGVVRQACSLAAERSGPSLRRVINATGIVLHTNLGRALLGESVAAAVAEAATRPTNLEYDLAAGQRGSRHDHLSRKLRQLSGADDGFAVNNNAGAVLLMLNTLAEGREVIVSRGELVEIGGSFRIPEVMRKSGARLVEVGTTNRTHLDDYRRALSSKTALILKVHTSNYRIVGFASEVGVAQLTELGAGSGVPVMYDLGSGAGLDFAAAAGLSGEPALSQAVGAGAGVITASGDKLLGGPQAGIILGRRDLLAAARSNPLARALRLDKLTIAALQATLDIYLRHAGDLEALRREIPAVAAITRSGDDLRAAADELAATIAAACGTDVGVQVVPGTAEVGGGSFPALSLPAWLVAVSAPGASAGALAAGLRAAPVPVIARVESGRVLLDPRTLAASETALVAEAVQCALGYRSVGGERRGR